MGVNSITCDEALYQEWYPHFAPKPWDEKHSSNTINTRWNTPSEEVIKTKLEVLVREIEQPIVNRFREEAEKWESETLHLSSPTQKMMHQSYLTILGLARENKREVIRLMLKDLKEKRRPWYWALSYLTQENPIKSADAGRIDKMIKAWIAWGKQKGYL